MNAAKKAILTGMAVVLLIAALGITYLAARDNGVVLRPDDARVTALGRQVYMDHCASCHGDELQGQADWRSPGPDGKLPAPPHDLTGHTWHHADQLLFELTKYGLKKFAGEDYKSDMPVYDGVLSDQEIIAVLSFIKSTWPANIRAHHDEINAAAQSAAE